MTCQTWRRRLRGLTSWHLRAGTRARFDTVVCIVDVSSSPVKSTKPKLRGWLHAVMFPIAIVAGGVLVATAPTQESRVSSAIFSATSALLFGTSALFHLGSWSPRVGDLIRRMDHSNIYLIIAARIRRSRLSLCRRTKVGRCC